MSNLATLARPYAKAAFELAQGADALGEWQRMLDLVSEMVNEPAMADLLGSPHVSSAQVVGIMLDTAGDAVNDRFGDFLNVLSENDRLALLPEITGLFAEQRREAEKRLSVTVVSAIELDENQANRLSDALSRRFDREVELVNEVDASVIDGAIVYAGDQVIDGSLRGRLEKLSNSLAN